MAAITLQPGVYNALLRRFNIPEIGSTDVNPSFQLPGVSADIMSSIMGGKGGGGTNVTLDNLGSNAQVTQPPDQTQPSQGGQTSVDPYSTSTSDYDYDPTYDTTVRGLTNQQNQANSQYSQGVNQVNSQFQPAFQSAETQNQLDLRRMAAQMANQGILRSSNNLFGQGQLESAYSQNVGGLYNQQQQALEGLARQRNSTLQDLIQQQINAQGQHTQFISQKELERANQEAAAKAAEDAITQQKALQQQQIDAQNQAAQQFANTVQPNATGQLQPTPPPPPSPAPAPTSITSGPYQSYNPDPSAIPPEWRNVPNGWYGDIPRQVAWGPQDKANVGPPPPQPPPWDMWKDPKYNW